MYPELAAVVGSVVPDYRGRFLRHVGENSAALGVAQGDAMRNFTGTFGWAAHHLFYPHATTGVCYNGYNPNADSIFTMEKVNPERRNYVARIGLDVSRQIPVAGEIRPRNMAVKYLVRAGE